MILYRLTFLFLFLSFAVTGQQSVKITYERIYNNQPADRGTHIVAIADKGKTLITTDKILAKSAALPSEQTVYFHSSKTIDYLTELSEGKAISSKDTLKYSYELLPDTKDILGYKCQKAKTIINSNTIEIWYTKDLPFAAAPALIGIDLGTVLETIRNGNMITRAKTIEKDISMPALSKAEAYDLLSYRDLKWKSRFITIPVFDKELINWNEETKAKEGVLRFANGTLIVRKVKFPEITTDKQVFIELKQRSNGDAYDRTGSVFVIPEGRETNFFDGLKNGINTLPTIKYKNEQEYQGYLLTDKYLPNVELMRFFTSFGISHFNTNKIKDKEWLDSTPFRQEITDLRSVLSGKELYVGTYIGNYDKGGHEVSMEVTIHNGGSSYHNFDFSLPVFNTVNVMEMGGQNYATLFGEEKGLTVEFSLDRDIKDAKLRYITTGHGGWGNGDEFLPKSNRIFIDQLLVHSFTPWRQDCGSYRLSNPVSGNFASGLSSSDLSRSNWCPATVTNPVFIDLGDLKAGKHSIQVKIPQGEREGTSFSFWNVSGVLLGSEKIKSEQ
jgi:hypothetical protein